MLDEFEADVDQRVSVLKAAGLLEFLDPLTEFGFETIEVKHIEFLSVLILLNFCVSSGFVGAWVGEW